MSRPAQIPVAASWPVSVFLPFPPSQNRLWRVAGRSILSAEAREFYRQAKKLIALQLRQAHIQLKPIARPCAVNIVVYPPDKRKRDLDNLAKAVLDALQKGGLLEDDALVCSLRMAWGEACKPGGCGVEIEPIEFIPAPGPADIMARLAGMAQ